MITLCYHYQVNRPNWTSLSAITITYQQLIIDLNLQLELQQI